MSAAPAGGVAGFGDVEPERFYTTPIQWMVDTEVTTGTSRACFSPDDSVTRGQAAAFLWRIEGFPEPVTMHPFTDVTAEWQQKPVSWMAEEKITTGTSPTTYSPDDILTRGQMAALIHRAAGEPAGAPPHPFVDVVAPWQQTPVSWMAEEEITTGTSPTMFSPDDPVTRGQFAAFSYRWQGEPAAPLDERSPLCSGIDEFDGGLEQGWTWTSGDDAGRSFTTMPGYLTVTGGGPGEFQTLLRDPVADEYEIETKVGFAPSANFQSAGLVVQADDNNSISLVRAHCDSGLVDCVGDGIYFDNNVEGAVDNTGIVLAPGTGDVHLRIFHKDGTYTGSYSLDGITWQEVTARTRELSSPRVGITTGNSTVDPVPPADFDFFTELPL